MPLVHSVMMGVQDLVRLSVINSRTIRKLINVGLPDVQEGAALLRELKSFNFDKQLLNNAGISARLTEISKLLVAMSNCVYVASSTRIMEGLNNQLKSNEDTADIDLRFDIEDGDMLTQQTLGVRGIPVMDYLRLILASVFSEQWLVANISQSFAAESTFEDFVSQVSKLTASRERQLTREIQRVVFYVAQEALYRANKQLAEIKVMTK
jgi:hypothetical protein